MAQFRIDTQQFLPQEKTLFEVSQLATPDGNIVSSVNPLPVTLGNSVVQITSNNVNVTVPNTISVNSSSNNPVHVHLTEVGSSGNLTVPYMPIAGNVNVNNTLTITGNVSVNNFPATQNVNIHHSNGNNITKLDPLPTYVTSIPNLDNAPWEIQLARGLVANVASLHRSAYNPACDKDTEESIWVDGGIYPWSTWTSAQTLYVISTSASDTGQSIFVEGLDSLYNYQSETITTNGLTAVATVNSYLRLTKATIQSGNINANAGDVTFRLTSGTGTVIGHIGPNIGQTKLAPFTVPAGKTAFIMNIEAGSFNSGVGAIGTQIRLYTRPYGQIFTLSHIGEVVNGEYIFNYNFPVKMTEKTDMDIRAYSSGNGTRVSVNFDILLIDN